LTRRGGPHAFDDGDIACIADAVRPLLDGVSGLPMVLEPLGFFLTRDSPAFLGVVPTAPLLSLHHAICQAVGSVAGGLWPHYRTGTRLPHCTLAMHVADKAAVIEVVSGFSTPIPARAGSAHLVEIPGGRSRTRLAGT
jgi:hypothetical protein